MKDIAHKTEVIIDDLSVYFSEKDVWRLSQKTSLSWRHLEAHTAEPASRVKPNHYNQEMHDVPEACKAYLPFAYHLSWSPTHRFHR